MTTRDVLETLVALVLTMALAAASFVLYVGAQQRCYPALGSVPAARAALSALLWADNVYSAGFTAVARPLGAALCSPDRPGSAACYWAPSPSR